MEIDMEKHTKTNNIRLITLLADILMMVLAGIIAWIMRFGLSTEYMPVPEEHMQMPMEEVLSADQIYWYIVALAIIIISTLFFLYLHHLYDSAYKIWSSQIPKITTSLVYGTMVFFMFSFINREVFYSRLVIGYFLVLALIFLYIGRFLTNQYVKYLHKKGIDLKNVLVICPDNNLTGIMKILDEESIYGYKIIGYIGNKREIEYNFLGSACEYKKIIKKHNIETLIMPIKHTKEIKEILEFCEVNYIQTFLVPEIVNLITSPIEVGEIGAVPLIHMKEGMLSFAQAKIKRFFDLIIAVTGIIILSPLFLLIGILIKTTSRGKVFFVQKRYGLNKKEIRIYKFRTMVEKADEKLQQVLDNDPAKKAEYEKYKKLKNDPRITKIGKILRKTSMDELPQILNVIKGDISIVGPRAMLLDELDRYGEEANIILKVKPGITGLWQVSGRSTLPFSERVRLDIYYITNWSFGLDIFIVLRTIPVVLTGYGAE
jgi:exopolysaccharide biosynthesis polyprenyl glycosylphosphotransferase